MRNPFGNISAPQSGYIWDYARRPGVRVRSYGELVQHQTKSPSGDVVEIESVPGLKRDRAELSGWDLETRSSGGL